MFEEDAVEADGVCDWSFDLTDVAMNQWESSVKADLVTILISNMRVMEREINSVLARDITDEELKLNVCYRITLEVAILPRTSDCSNRS